MSGHLHSVDGLMIYRQGIALAYHHSLHFPTIWWGIPIDTSKYGIGLSLLYVPGLLLFSGLRGSIPVQHGQTFDFGLYYNDPLYTVAAAPVHVILTAATAYLVARLLRELGFGRRIALAGMLLFGLGSPAIIYARGDWAQPLLAFCWLAAILAAVRFRRTAGRGPLLACAAALFYAVLTRPVEGTLLLPCLALIVLPSLRLRRDRSAWRAAATLGGSYLLSVVVTLLLDWARFGSPFNTGYGGEGWTTPIFVGLSGALVSPARGILWQFPAVLLAALGVLQLWGGPQRRVALALAGLAGLQLLNVALWHDWWGGANWGLRLFVPALAPLAVLAAAGLTRLPRPSRPWVVAGLLLAGLAWAAPALLTDLFGGYTVLADGSDGAFHLQALPLIGAWQYLHHLRALSVADPSAVDIVWVRYARATSNLSLLAPALLAMATALLGVRVSRLAIISADTHDR